MRRRRRNPIESNEWLDYLLAPRGQTRHIGPERGRTPRDGIGLLKSTSPGPYVSYRYVYSVAGQIAAALQVMVDPRRRGRVANVFTAPGHRRRGLALALLDRAESDLGPVELSEDLSVAGAAWQAAVRRRR